MENRNLIICVFIKLTVYHIMYKFFKLKTFLISTNLIEISFTSVNAQY